MEPIAKLVRGFRKWLFKVRGLATIPGIPTGEFHALIGDLQAQGWKKTHEYRGFDAWVDYGCVHLRRGSRRLRCEWDNWDEGSIEGPHAVIQELSHATGRPAVDQWRWAVWDRNRPAQPGR